MDAASLAKYAGDYEFEDSGKIIPVTVAVKGGHLVATAMGSETEIYPESETKFFAFDLSFSLVFLKNPAGAVTGFVINGSVNAVRK